jgi:hypothetical protein
LNDIDFFNNVVVPSSYVGYNIENETNGLTATVLNFANGYQTTPPNLKTLYIKYTNTGNTGTPITNFSAGDTLTVYNPVTNPVQQVNIVVGGIAFSNSDSLVALSQIICTSTTGTPTPGTYLNNGNGLSNVQIMEVTSLPTANQYVLQIAPRSVDLANSQCNSQYWSFSVNDSLTNPASTLALTLNQIVGAGLQGNVITNSVGTIINVPLTGGGVGYIYNPFITIQSIGNLTGYTTLNLQAQNFLTQIIVASSANSVGNGYAFGVTQGIIYQKGMLLQVNPQQVIVSPFNQFPNSVAVGFITNEQIINYNIDNTLLDNANGAPNYQAPGADRLQLTPQLIVISVANAQSNSEFLSLVQWNQGQPVTQQQQTIYSTIGAEMAQRTEDADGNFVIKPFSITTQTDSTQNTAIFNIIADPGEAYINGYKVATSGNYTDADDNGTDTAIVNNHTISLNYGNYLIINNVAGSWSFNTGASVNFYNQAQQYYTNVGGSLNPAGTLIGTACMRSMTLYEGQPGLAGTQYLLYLFNIQMNNGQNFTNVASISYNSGSANVAIADVVLSSSLGSNSAVLQQTNLDQLVFWSGVNSLKNANNVIYTYRTVNTSLTTSNGGASNASITINITSGSETFPYGLGTLSSIQLEDFYVVPTGGDMLYTVAAAGTVVANSANANIVANTGTAFQANLSPGDFVYVTANTTGGHTLAQILSITNSTFLTLNTAPSFSNGVATLIKVFPENIPIPFGFKPALTGNVTSGSQIITLTFGHSFTFSGTTATTVAYNVERSNNPTQLTKTANRQNYVELCTSNNAGGSIGPWCLGIPDIFRLRAVYIGNSAVTNSGTNYVSNFYVDPNQNSDFYGLGYLYINQGSSPPLTANSYLLVEFDNFTSTGVGYYDTVSYLQSSNANTIYTNDSLPLANLTTFCNSLEVPEVFLNDGTEIDLLGYLDFRPYAVKTATATTNSLAANLNPSSTVTLSTSGEKKFPLPDSNFIATIEGWEGRIDSLFINQNGVFTISSGTAEANLSLCIPPLAPSGVMKIVDIAIPPYPTLPTNLGVNLTQILDTSIISNQKFLTTRVNDHTIYNLSANSSLPYTQPPVWTQAEIGALAAQVQQLQYYVTTNQAESNAANMLIPSSVNSSENRTAYGIFTDNFTTSDFSALNDPEYSAIKQGTNIVPEKMLWDQSMYGVGTTPYIQYPIIQQDNATVGGTTDPLGLGPVCALNLANTVAYNVMFRNIGDIESSTNPTSITDIVNITMADSSTVSGTVEGAGETLAEFLTTTQYAPYSISAAGATPKGFEGKGPGLGTLIAQGWESITYTGGSIYFQSAFEGNNIILGVPPAIGNALVAAFKGQISWQTFFAGLNVTGTTPTGGSYVANVYNPPVAFYFYNYTNGVRYDIYQGTTLIASTDPTAGVATCQNLTASDIALLEGSAGAYWFNDNPSLYMQNFNNLTGGYANYAGKILFNYNPANGSQFSIKTSMSPSSSNWRWALAYPIDGASVGCVPSSAAPITSSGAYTPIYSSFSIGSGCGNLGSVSGQISIITGFTSTWNGVVPTPTTTIVPFDASADWA